MITLEELKQILRYEDGQLFWLKQMARRVKLGERAGTFDFEAGYWKINIKKRRYYIHKLVFFIHHGHMPKFVDHIDTNSSNNLISNLREATKNQNCHNRKSNINSSSKYKGVSKHANGRAWVAAISHYNNHTYLGYFKNENQAALAYNRAAVMYHKEFAVLNIIEI